MGHGVSSDAFAEANGNFEVAIESLQVAKVAAKEAWDDPNCTNEVAERKALHAASSVL